MKLGSLGWDIVRTKLDNLQDKLLSSLDVE